ncbi:MAG: DUF1844 domain-containing protein [Calditrichaeota bacterium]|nr:DUF1844 domain-containing protein [Calditrichota bacterium]
MEKLSHEQKNEMLFFSLVEQWRFQAWMSLGKIKNPATNKIERNLEMAKMAIDMLDMLKEKTSGNLTENEERLLTQTLADLKLNYVDEYEKEKREKARQAEQQTAERSAEAKEAEKPKEEASAQAATEASGQKAAESDEKASSKN